MTPPDEAPLFTPCTLGELQLRNRAVMASMTRGRARNAEFAPTELHVEYYRQRAAAGLILTEGTWISPRAIGFINAPGLFTERQVEGWRAVTSAVPFRGRCNLRAACPLRGGLTSRLFRWRAAARPVRGKPRPESIHARRFQGHGDAACHVA